MKSSIPGVVIRPLEIKSDQRGWLLELFRSDELPESLRPEMAYLSQTEPGYTRGPHEHTEQTDCFVFLGDVPFKLYLWDHREPGAVVAVPEVIDLTAGQPVMVIVPVSGASQTRTEFDEEMQFCISSLIYRLPNSQRDWPESHVRS